MNRKIIQATALAAAICLAGTPAISQAVTAQSATPVQVTYRTTLRSQLGLGAPWSGTLQLTINPDGIIQGYYHPAGDEIAFIPVTGGRSGKSIWLDIGRNGRLHVDGTMKKGVIVGTAFDGTTDQPYDFTARA